MILFRTVFQAKPGKAANVVAAVKAGAEQAPAEMQPLIAALQLRILTDISGPTDTVVVETTHASLAAVEQFRAAMFANAGDSSPMESLVVSARNEYYTIEHA